MSSVRQKQYRWLARTTDKRLKEQNMTSTKVIYKVEKQEVEMANITD